MAVVEPIPARRRRDWVLTAVLALIGVASVSVEGGVPLWVAIVPTVVGLGFIPFRRQMPLLAVVSVGVAAVLSVAVGARGSEAVDAAIPAGVADIVLLYALCRWASPRRAAVGFMASLVGMVVVEALLGTFELSKLPLGLPWFLVAAVALAMRYRARAIAIRHDQIRLLERHALARDLHDSVAHHVSAMAVQAQAGQYVMRSDPEAAAEVLRSIESAANSSLDEMRRMVGILRSDDDLARSTTPTSLDSLSAPDAIPAVEIRDDARLDDLPLGVSAALFRIAQESITNARRHSREVSFVRIAVERSTDRVRMIVENDGTPTTRHAGSGYGLLGMRERAEALGGEFESIARPSTGWRTTTSIPLARSDG